jgi:hypothetical protein
VVAYGRVILNKRRVMKLSQNMQIQKHLSKHGEISTWTAFKKYNITRLSARIWDLRNIYGMSIADKPVTKKKKRFTLYYI